ncbi:MAG: gluconate 2-dehydrogenase subunit 3 family protein [Acidobacteriaceae bacterium]|nr:gluconate 2-dehydrogenase subunit 3 family protein [Acidobacteriaceae bacterium]
MTVIENQGAAPLTDPKTGENLQPGLQPGYYPGYHTLGQKKFWDAATRELVEKRVSDLPPIRFFTAEELPIITAICERILPQDDRVPERKIPIVPRVDERLATGRIDGYRYEGMPPDRDAYRWAIRAIDAAACRLHSLSFADLDVRRQDEILKSLHDSEKPGGEDLWSDMPVERFWQLLVSDCVTAYYAHPWAWDEIGFGGPAYPRAYTRLEGGLPEPWEVDEQRYDWAAPADSISDRYEPLGAAAEGSHHGQGGTH